jgi:predicted nucleotidyltransferase/6-phosphogluconolactonase (cycloisomerase 2 family)
MSLRAFFKWLALLGVLAFVSVLRAGDVALSDGQNAEDVVGQYDSGGNPVFNQGTAFNSQRLEGFNLPYDVQVDTVSHRLFVLEYRSSRIMVYDLDSSNNLVDRTADNVLGQTNFFTNNAALSQNRLYSCQGFLFDATSNRLFVGDSGNNRVIIYDVATIIDGENATNVLGQSNFTSGGAATTISGMKFPSNFAYDLDNNRLFVSDTNNHRILVYNLASLTDGENAVNVLGQLDFTSGSNATEANRFYAPRQLAFDRSSNRLFVVDRFNSRVLVFDVASITNGENAVNILGQSNFTSSGSATSINKLKDPFGLAFSNITQRLFVGESSNNRVTVFDVAAITDGENAVNVLGQSTFTTSANRITQDGMDIPRGVTLDDDAQRLFVVDQNNFRVTVFDVSTISITDGENAENVAGQTDGGGGGVYITGGAYDSRVVQGLNFPYDVSVDTVSHRIFVADHGGLRVLVYDLDTSNSLVDRTVDHVLGQVDFSRSVEVINQYSTGFPRGLAFDSSRNLLFVCDIYRNRVMVYDVSSITDGENAINVLGQSSFNTLSSATTLAGLSSPYGLSLDIASNRLYVGESGNHRVTVFDVNSITDGENAVHVLGQPDFTTGASATTATGLNTPRGVHVSGNHLYVGDSNNHRVMVFDTTSITDGESAVNVLGQSTFTTGTSGLTINTFNHPTGVTVDSATNRLFVSDYSNHRVLVFDVATVTNGENAINVLGQSNFTTGSVTTTQSGMYFPTGITFEPGMNRLYVAELYNNRVLVQSVGPVPPSTSTLAAVSGGQAGAIDLSWPSAGDDGVFNDLTGYYRIQYATYTATWSTSTTPTNAYTSTITATGVTPGVVQSTTVYVSPTVQPWYFVIWTQDDASNWSAISSTVSASPPPVIPDYGVGPFEVASVGGGLSQGGTAWGDFDNDGDLDVLVSGTDGTNNQVRVYESYGDGSFNSTAVNVAAATSGLKDGDVAFGDYDNDGDLDVLVNGTDGTNNQLRVYKNNGNGTFNTTAVEVAGTNSGLKQGGVAWGDYDNDGDLDVLVSGTDGTNNQLRVYTNKGDGTFDTTAINVAGLNSGLRQGSVAWGDFDQDGDMDVLVNGTNGTNRQLRVYENEGDGTFNSTGIEVAGVNSGLSDGRVVWSDFDKDGYLDVLVSGTDGTNNQLRVYMNNGNGTFNSTPVNVAGSNTGITHSAVAVGDYNVDGNQDILAAGRPTGLTGYWKLDENTGTSTADSSGNGATGTFVNGPSWATGKFGSGVSFDGTARYIDTAVTTQYSKGTVSVWVNPTFARGSSDYFWPFNSSTYGDLTGFQFQTYGGGCVLSFFIRGNYSTNLTASKSIATNADLQRWQHLVGVWDIDSGIWLYRDGVLVSSTAGTTSMFNLGNQYIGTTWNSTSQAFLGTIDEVRTYSRMLTPSEIAGLYQATKSSIGTLRLHKGQGDGTFNATPVEVDAGLEQGNVAWGDADGDGDLDILTAGTDGANPQLSVYLSTQSLTASNTAPSAPGTLAGSFAFDPSGVSVASFTWTAGTDSGTGTTTENALNYELQISTKSDFNPLVVPGNQGASPRMGAYLRPPKTFAGSTYGVMLKSTDPWNAQTTAGYGLRTDTTYYYQVKAVDAGLATSGWSTSGTLNTGVAPSTSTLGASTGPGSGEVTLTWSSAGDDGMSGDLTGNFRIQYATYTASWSTASTPTNAFTLTISTTGVTPGVVQSTSIAGLTVGITYYFALFTEDESNNWSTVSNTTSAIGGDWFDSTQIEVDGVNNGLRYGRVAWGDFDNDGDLDILVNGTDGTYRQLRVYKNNGDGSFDPAQIEVGGANGGLQDGGVAWGDFDNDGDLDVLVSGTQGSAGRLRIYKNNGDGSFDSTPINVSSPATGHVNGGVAWGDFDNDGDLDVLANGGEGATTYQLRVYKNNGNGTMDPAPIEVAGRDLGLRLGSVAWGDFDNDGDLDILTNGFRSNHNLRVFKNNGNGTFDPTEIDVDGPGFGLSDGTVAWGDFDQDGDLDILVSGFNGTNRQLRVYKNNGNGTFDTSQIEVDGLNGGLRYSDVAWGDFDNDGDLDILVSGSDGSSPQLRVYMNNGNGTFDGSQIEVDGLNGGLQDGGVAWGDFDNDGDLDILASGYDGANSQLRVYKNSAFTANTPPSAPATLTANWDYSPTGLSTATFKWIPGVDNGADPTPADGLTYQLEISTTSGFTGKSFVAGQWASPGVGNYLRPPKTYDGNTAHGVGLRYLPLTNTTYYFRVKTIDAGLKESAWSTTESLYTLVASSEPSAVTDLAAGEFGEGQIGLAWTAPLNIQSGGNAAFDIRYSTVGAITNDTEFTNATPITGEPTPGVTGTTHLFGVIGLEPLKTYYFAIKSTNDNGTSPLDTVSPRPSAVASYFNATQIEVDGINGGPVLGSVAWGDFDNDGDLDILTCGSVSGFQLRVYENNGNGTFNTTQIEVAGVGQGLYYSSVAWGDFDSDGDLDILISGYNGSTRQLRVYKNDGNGTFNSTPIDVDGVNNGLEQGGVDWGDFDNDGDLDILVCGSDGTNYQLRVFKNNGNGTFDSNQIEVDGLNGGLYRGKSVWGDFDNDGDLDILINGYDGTNPQLRVYKNNGDGTFDGTQIEVDGLNGGLYVGAVAWGDFDNDGDLDILENGYNAGLYLRVYKNNGNGTFDPDQIEIDGNNGLDYGSVAWGDYDNDGDLDVLTCGYQAGTRRQLRVYTNNGNGTFDPNQIEVDGLYGGLNNGEAVWGDYDNDGDLDILANGYDGLSMAPQLRVYTNLSQTVNTSPTAPTLFAGAFGFDPTTVSVASFTWNAGTDSGSGATPENVLTYDVQISTEMGFSPLLFPGQMGATPRMGSYQKPPKIFNSNAYYGVVLKSADPWNEQTTASYGLRTDTTYYYRVKTVDSALAESGWSDTGTLNTAVPPSTSTLVATAGAGSVTLGWDSAGDDGMIGDLTGNYRIQYATYTVSWSTASTPTDANTVTIATTSVTPGSAQSKVITGLTGDLLYYFVLWSQDEANNWSGISNTTSAVPSTPITVTLAEAVGQAGWMGRGETQRILGTAQVVSNSESGVTISSVAVQASGYTADANLTNVEV